MSVRQTDQTEAPVFFQMDEPEHADASMTTLGFWIYLMSDCLIFAVLFACYGVYGDAYAAGPSPADLFELPLVALNTAILLVSAVTYGFAMLAMHGSDIRGTQMWLSITGALGALFVGIEVYEFLHLIHEGAPPGRSAFLSTFFALVGTHALHVAFGVVWLVTLMAQVQSRGLNEANQRRLMCLSMFWHFLDIVWVGVFTFVYLLGVL